LVYKGFSVFLAERLLGSEISIAFPQPHKKLTMELNTVLGWNIYVIKENSEGNKS